jgi:hypothetical protein
MVRLLATSTLALTLVALGCSGGAKPPAGDMGTGGATEDTGGSPGTGGSKPSGVGGSTGGSGDTGGAGGSATGGSGDTGGAGGAGGMSMADAAMMSIDSGADAQSTTGDGGVMLGGEVQASKPWIHLCPKAWNQQQCCQLLCQCLDAYCQSSPMDKPRIAGCMPMCMGLTDLRARCQVYHCFESQSPTATKDHDSHCGHASGRVGGGSCTIIQMQP